MGYTLVGAIATGSVEGALSSGTTAVSIPAVDAYLEKQGVDETTRDALLLGLSAAAGAVIGGDTASTATSFSQTQNNYLTHKQIAEWGKELESCVKNRGNKCTVSVKEAINNKYTKKSEQQQQELKSACGTNGNAQKCDTLRNKYYNVEGIPYDKQADKYAPKIISYGYGSKANSKLAVIQTMHNVEAEGIFAQQTANQERAKGRSGKAFAMEMAPVIAGSVIAGKMGSSRGTIKPPTNEKVPTNGNKNNASPNTTNANAQAALKAKLSALQNAQNAASKSKTLPDGRVRYYTQEKPASTSGNTRGASFVTEHNPTTGSVRQWMESYNHKGEVIRINPKSLNGQQVTGQHYPPTGKELGR